MRKAASALAMVVSCVLSQAALGATDARLQGSFAMTGRITFVDNVYGEHHGQKVLRSWTFTPWCAAGVCRAVTLYRTRSGRRILNVVVLKRSAPGVYAGRGRFWLALNCAGEVVAHGGLATEQITVRVVRTQMVGTTRFATALRARYVNPRRANLTRCPGGIGHDAARYRGQLASPLPGPPSAGFDATADPATHTAMFADTSTPGRGHGQVVSWQWNFGDSASAADTSTQQDPTHTYTAPGTYTVTLEIRDVYGQTATTTSQITV